MDSELPDDNDMVPEDVARALIARAAELDSHAGNRSKLSELRATAAQVGISPVAFEAALAEMRAEPAVPAEPTRGRWTSAWDRLTTRTLARFGPGWLGTMLTLGLVSGSLNVVGPRELGLLTMATLAAISGHAMALALTGRAGDASRRSGSLQSAIAGALLPFTFAGLQILQVIRSPMTYRSTTVIWFVLSALLALVIAAIGHDNEAAQVPPDSIGSSKELRARDSWWSKLSGSSIRERNRVLEAPPATAS